MESFKDYKADYSKAFTTSSTLLRDNEIKDTFVQVVKIAQSLGLSIHESDTGDYNSILYFDKKLIYINTIDIESRQRFMIAKMVGHYVLHNGLLGGRHEEVYKSFVYDQSKDDPKEREADIFAHNLLIPSDLITYYVNSETANLVTLSKLFGVDPTMMANRLAFYYGGF
jgi:Zn-dependent peptidase ImmA (M78 family)